jgi:hypothetical protein
MPTRAATIRAASLGLAAVLFTLVLASTAAAAPAQWASLQVRLIQGQNGSPVTIVSGKLPSSVKLPATGLLSVPSGIQPSWVGQILGGDVAKDPTATYTTTSKSGYDELALTLTQAPEGQVEYADQAALTKSGQTSQVNLKWTSPVNMDRVTFLVEIPQGAKVTSAGGAALDPSTGGGFYSKTFSGVKAGKPLSLSLAYTGGTSPNAAQPPGTQSPAAPGAVPPASTVGGGATSPIPFVIGAALVLGLLYFYVQRRQQVSSADDADADLEDEEPEPAPAPTPAASARRSRSVSRPAAKQEPVPVSQDDDYEPFADDE